VLSGTLRKRAVKIVDRLDQAYPEARLELDFSSPFELLIATILAAQCTDAKVNEVTMDLFKKYKRPADYLKPDFQQLVDDLQGITFPGNKTKYIKKTCEKLLNEYDGQVPNSLDGLTKLSGVGRKTANIVLANAMGIPAIGVDTHTIRVPNRLGLVDTEEPLEIEERLCELLPKDRWHRANIVIQWHGRYTCQARKPKCGECAIFDLCEWSKKGLFT
jgi:endonuclease-3